MSSVLDAGREAAKAVFQANGGKKGEADYKEPREDHPGQDPAEVQELHTFPKTGKPLAGDAEVHAAVVLGADHPPEDAWVESAFASRYAAEPIPKDTLPKKSMPAPVAYQLIRDMRQLDSNPRLNLASFVTTWMEPEAEALIKESLNVNYVDMEEYPSSTEIQNRCVSMLADLYHADDVGVGKACGTACIGSSEAILLAGLAMKRRWEKLRKAQGKPINRPNLVMGANVQVCWHKFTRYFDVEEKFVPCTVEPRVLISTPEGTAKLVDENTIGVVGILGSTYTGEYEDIEGMDAELEAINKRTGWDVKMHIDGASGGFCAPFADPELKWDFRLRNVVSVNSSGHKYGLVYPGLGWVIWRSKQYLPEELIFHTNYLGSDQPSFTLNFSKSASMIIAQYYQFLRLGFDGYRKIMLNLRNVAKRLENGIRETGHFTILSNDTSLPLVAFALNQKTSADGQYTHDRRYDVFDVSDKLRALRGWILPAYSAAPDAQSVKMLRAVVREDLSMSMVDELVADIQRAIQWLDSHYIFDLDQMRELKSKFAEHRLDENIYRKKHTAGVC